jgi:hypothetical protein
MTIHTDHTTDAFTSTLGALLCQENTTSGSGLITPNYGYLYTSTGSAIGSGIADYFPATSTVNLTASSIYDIEAVCYFLKSTAGTVTWTWVASSAPNMMNSYYTATAATGFTTTISTSAAITGIASIQTNTSLAHAATASLTTAVYHVHRFKGIIATNAATTLKLRVTSSAGTVTPQIGSYYLVRRIAGAGTLS